MATYQIETTAEQEAALTYSFERARQPSPVVPPPPPPEGVTQAQYFQARIDATVLAQMVWEHKVAADARLVASLQTIPPEHQAAAAQDVGETIVSHGGEIVPLWPNEPEGTPLFGQPAKGRAKTKTKKTTKKK